MNTMLDRSVSFDDTVLSSGGRVVDFIQNNSEKSNHWKILNHFFLQPVSKISHVNKLYTGLISFNNSHLLKIFYHFELILNIYVSN